ncbi:Protein kinase domain-containing protein [Aphelenchoides besseyi]|nr:Protein kinase domain-containing protein [Aphelenchoides besseyi]
MLQFLCGHLLISNSDEWLCAPFNSARQQNQNVEGFAAIDADLNANDSMERLPQVNETIAGKMTHVTYRLLSVIGDGGYGTVFEATDGVRKVAVKTEKFSRSMLHVEAHVLRTATRTRCNRIAELIDYGDVPKNFYFLVMPLLGKDLHHLRNEQRERRFSHPTSLRIGIMSLQAIQELHEKCGFLSRDIKSGNYAVGLAARERDIFLIDFGLARKYLDRNRNVMPSRGEVGWRGTTRYGSLNAHLKLDLGRKDDVESWFYMMVELTKGAVPWRQMTDRAQVHAAKLSARSSSRAQFLSECPVEYDVILTHIDSLTFADAPNYKMIITLLEEAMRNIRATWQQQYDWEDEITHSTTSLSNERPEAQSNAPINVMNGAYRPVPETLTPQHPL